MPPQRATFRHTAWQAPEATAPGSAAVSSIASQTSVRCRSPRQRGDAMHGLLSQLEARPAPARAECASAAGTSQAPLASTRSATYGPTAARTAARRPASSPTPDIDLHADETPPPRQRRRPLPRPRDRARPTVALTGVEPGGTKRTAGFATGRPARLPGEVPEGDVERGERLGEGSRRPQLVEQRAVGRLGTVRPGRGRPSAARASGPVIGVEQRPAHASSAARTLLDAATPS